MFFIQILLWKMYFWKAKKNSRFFQVFIVPWAGLNPHFPGFVQKSCFFQVFSGFQVRVGTLENFKSPGSHFFLNILSLYVSGVYIIPMGPSNAWFVGWSNYCLDHRLPLRPAKKKEKKGNKKERLSKKKEN